MRGQTWRRITVGIALAVALLALSGPGALRGQDAADPARKFRTGDSITIGANETIAHDLYLAGGTITVDGRVQGDLVIAGGTVTVRGPVEGDLFIAGGTVDVTSNVEQHLRVGGGQVTVGGAVRRDIMAGAGTFTLAQAARAGEDLIVGAGTLNLNGRVDGSVLASVGQYSKNGTIGGSERVTLNSGEAAAAEAAGPSVAERILGLLRRYLGIVLLGLLLFWLPPRLLTRAATRLREQAPMSLGVGVTAFIGFFALLLGLLLLVVLIAVPLGLLGFGRLAWTAVFTWLLGSGLLSFVFGLVVFFLAQAIVGLTLGRLLLRPLNQPANDPYLPLLLGVLVVVIVTALPYIGGVLDFVAILLGLGALVLAVWRRRDRRPAPAPALA